MGLNDGKVRTEVLFISLVSVKRLNGASSCLRSVSLVLSGCSEWGRAEPEQQSLRFGPLRSAVDQVMLL